MTKKFFKRDNIGRPVVEMKYTPVLYQGKEYALYKSLITGYWQIADPIDGKTVMDFNGRTLTKVQAFEFANKELPCHLTKT